MIQLMILVVKDKIKRETEHNPTEGLTCGPGSPLSPFKPGLPGIPYSDVTEMTNNRN